MYETSITLSKFRSSNFVHFLPQQALTTLLSDVIEVYQSSNGNKVNNFFSFNFLPLLQINIAHCSLSSFYKDFRQIQKNVYKFKPIRGDDFSEYNCKLLERCDNGMDCINRSMFIECNPNRCPCGQECQNMRIQKGVAPTFCRFSTSKGIGLIARQFIEKGTFLIEYMGEVITKDEFEHRMATTYSNNVHQFGSNIFFSNLEMGRGRYSAHFDLC